METRTKSRRRVVRKLNKTNLEKFKDVTLGHLLKGLGVLTAKFYLTAILVYSVLNFVILNSVSGVKPLDACDTILLVVLINFIRTPKKPISDTVHDLITEE